MASYKLEIQRTAERELRKLVQPDLRRIIHTIHALPHDPRPPGARLLKGPDRHWRVRQGDYRIVYEIDDAQRLVKVIKIGHRREIYER